MTEKVLSRHIRRRNADQAALQYQKQTRDKRSSGWSHLKYKVRKKNFWYEVVIK